MNAILEACGAHGRQANITDWRAGKDFKILGGPYFSIRDLQKIKNDGYKYIRFSYRHKGVVVNFTVNTLTGD
jgi:hypothetical protein